MGCDCPALACCVVVYSKIIVWLCVSVDRFHRDGFTGLMAGLSISCCLPYIQGFNILKLDVMSATWLDGSIFYHCKPTAKYAGLL